MQLLSELFWRLRRKEIELDKGRLPSHGTIHQALLGGGGGHAMKSKHIVSVDSFRF